MTFSYAGNYKMLYCASFVFTSLSRDNLYALFKFTIMTPKNGSKQIGDPVYTHNGIWNINLHIIRVYKMSFQYMITSCSIIWVNIWKKSFYYDKILQTYPLSKKTYLLPDLRQKPQTTTALLSCSFLFNILLQHWVTNSLGQDPCINHLYNPKSLAPRRCIKRVCRVEFT